MINRTMAVLIKNTLCGLYGKVTSCSYTIHTNHPQEPLYHFTAFQICTVPLVSVY